MVTFPNAKINIGLFITDRRADGYHDIATAMIPVDWCDILEIVPAKGSVTTLTVTGRNVDCPPEKNLVMRAYHAMEQRFDIPPVDIYLDKIIPDGAGLGGGSADAAFTIKVLNEIFKLDLSINAMAEIAATIGSDCPFFIYNRPMLATGTGTTLSPIDIDLKGYHIAIVKPTVHVSTADAYHGCRPRHLSISPEQILPRLNPAQWTESGIANQFEETVFPLHLILAEVKDTLYNMGAVYAAMSGSGAALFGIFQRDILSEELEAAFPGMDIHLSI